MADVTTDTDAMDRDEWQEHRDVVGLEGGEYPHAGDS